MRVLVLGGDGYLGWPTAMHFSQAGHDVTIVAGLRQSAADTKRLTTLFPDLAMRGLDAGLAPTVRWFRDNWPLARAA